MQIDSAASKLDAHNSLGDQTHGSLHDLVTMNEREREQHRATVQDRVQYLKENIGDNADKHARELAAHGDAHSLAKKVAAKKIAENFLITTIKGIGCNWMHSRLPMRAGPGHDW